MVVARIAASMVQWPVAEKQPPKNAPLWQTGHGGDPIGMTKKRMPRRGNAGASLDQPAEVQSVDNGTRMGAVCGGRETDLRGPALRVMAAMTRLFEPEDLELAELLSLVSVLVPICRRLQGVGVQARTPTLRLIHS